MTTQTSVIAPYKPLPWQIAPWKDKSFILLLTGSAGGGKSRLAAEKMHARRLKYPNSMGLIIRKTRESMTNSTVLFLQRQIIGDDPRVKHVASMKRFEYSNGSILAYGGMKDEQQREQVRSIGADGGLDDVWFEEAHQFTLADYEEILARMRGKATPWRQIILTTNPDSPQHWIYKRLIQGREASVYYSRSTDNDYNPADYNETVLGKLSGVRKQRLKDGLWVQAEGAVYDEFRQDVHVIKPFDIPKDWLRFRAIDFGYTNPFVCQWWAVDPDGRLYLYREIYRVQRTVKIHAEEIKKLSDGEKIAYTVADHDAEDRATLAENGIPNIAAKKEISVGIQTVQEYLTVAGDGKPRLFIFEGCTVGFDPVLEAKKKPLSTEEEFSLYVWEKGKDGKPNKEVPVDDNNHGMDSARYAVMSQVHRTIAKVKQGNLWGRSANARRV